MNFTESHEWICVEEGIGTVGITDHAQKELGEIVYLELPSLGSYVEAGQEVAVLESTKAAADIYSPVSGEIVAINEVLMSSIHSIHSSAEKEGWLFKIRLTNSQEVDQLLDRSQYEKMVITQ